MPSSARTMQPIVPDICTVLDHDLGHVAMTPYARTTQPPVPVVRALLDHDFRAPLRPSLTRLVECVAVPPQSLLRSVFE